MNRARSTWRSGAIAVLSLAAGVAESTTSDGDAQVIGEWNQILESVLPAGGLSQPRNYALLHVAMFDAVNSVTRTHRPYVTRVRCPHWTPADVAAAQAARDVLAAQFPAALATFDAALQARLADVPPHFARPAIRVGQRVAAEVLAWRADDGWTIPAPAYVLPALPGFYQPTPPAFAPAAFRQFEHTRPFALLTPTQYLPPLPATITSAQYAADFNEVKEIGAANSTMRTAEQTQLARLFAGVVSRTAHWGLWNRVARDTAAAQGFSLVETARLLALLNVTIHDALQTSHTSKFVYGGWRPVTAIRRADEDLNEATAPDPSWTPLLTTPAYPSHAGNMACVGSSAARILGLVHGTDEMAFTAMWLGSTGQPDVSRPYSSFRQLAQDQADSRIYGGIHFRFESLASQASCPKVSQYVFDHYMRPLPAHESD